MKGLITRFTGAAGAVSLFLSGAAGALAQYDYYYDDYYYDGDVSDAGLTILGFTGVWLFFACCMALVSLAFLAFRIWMLIHVIQNAPEDQKVLWILLVLFVPFCDWVYFFTKKKEWSKK